MALEREGIQLVAEGAAQFITQMTAASSAVDTLLTKVSATERIRTKQLAPDLEAVTKAAQGAAAGALDVDEGLLKLGSDAQRISPQFAALVAQLSTLREQLENIDRIRTTGLAATLEDIQQGIQSNIGAAGVTRNITQLGQAAPGLPVNEATLLQRVAQAREELAQRSIQADRAAAASIEQATNSRIATEQALTKQIEVQAALRTDTRRKEVRDAEALATSRAFQGAFGPGPLAQRESTAAEQARRLSLARSTLVPFGVGGPTTPVVPSFIQPQIRPVSAANNEVENSLARLRAAAGTTIFGNIAPTIDQLKQMTAATDQVTESSSRKNRALSTQSEEHSKGRNTGISYLSTLSAIHAASFLLGGQTFTTVGSLTTLSLAFSKLGPTGIVAGAGLGTILFALSSLTNAFQTLVQVATAALQVVAGAAVAGGTAIGAAFGIAVNEAAGVEKEFALIRGVAGGTDKDLAELHDTVVELSREFGVSQQAVSQAASLYARAGGSIEEAIGGAARAVIQLTIASQGELGAPQAARAIAQIKQAFGAGPQEAADFVTGLAQKTTLSFTEITQALQQVGPAAANLKIPLLDIGAAIGVAAEAGLRGTVAGSGLKQVIIDLAAPSERAGKLLQQYRISLFQTNGEVRPLVDVFRDMNAAFGQQAVDTGKVTDAQRAYALSVIFGSRAGQAAAIIAKSGAERFIDLRNGIAAVTATDLANQVLVPTSKQLEITQQNALALAAAFGGPVNAAIGLGLNQFNKFLQTIGTDPFRVAGQAVVALATGQGFGQLNKAIDELVTDPAMRQFITDLLNLFLNVRDAITTQVVPAFVTAGTTIKSALETIDTSTLFQDLSRGARVVAAGISILITSFGDLVKSIVTNDERGQALKSTVAGLATAFGTTLVGGLVLAAVPMVVTITILQNIGKAVLDLLDDTNNFTNLWDLIWKAAGDSVLNFVRTISPKLLAVGELINAMANPGVGGEKLGAAIAKIGILSKDLTTGTDLRQTIAQIRNLTEEREKLVRHRDTLQLMEPEAPQTIAGLQNVNAEIALLDRQLQGLATQKETIESALSPGKGTDIFKQAIIDARAAATRIGQDFDLSDIVNRAEGSVTDALSNIITASKTAADRIADAGESGTTPGFLPDDKELGKAEDLAARIVEFINDTQTKIGNLEEDAANRSAKIVTDGLERMADAQQKFSQAVQDSRDKVEERITDIIDDKAIQRTERDFLKDFQRNQEEQSEIRSNFLSIQEVLHQQSLGRIKNQRDRDNQDLQRDFDIQQDLARQVYDNIASAAEISFKRVQRAQGIALSERQDAETKSLQKTLKEEADTRQLRLDLAKAKTPEERQGILDRSQQAKEDAVFEEGQQKKLDDLKKRQEREQRALSDSLEDQAFARRIQLQVAEFNFRLGLEAKAINFRRQLENLVRRQAEQDEFTELFRRFGLVRADTEFRRGQQDELQRNQDKIDDAHTVRNLQRIRREQTQQEQILGRNFAQQQARSAREIFEQLEQGGIQTDKSIRAILDSLTDKSEDFAKQAEKLGIPLPPEFFQIQALTAQVLELDAAFKIANEDKRRLFGERLDASFNAPGGLFDTIPSLAPQTAPPPTPLLMPLLPAVTQALSLATGPSVANAIAQGTYDALVRANQHGILNPPRVPLPQTGIPSLDLQYQTTRQGIRDGLRGY